MARKGKRQRPERHKQSLTEQIEDPDPYAVRVSVSETLPKAVLGNADTLSWCLYQAQPRKKLQKSDEHEDSQVSKAWPGDCSQKGTLFFRGTQSCA